jgi:hypothetical protein
MTAATRGGSSEQGVVGSGATTHGGTDSEKTPLDTSGGPARLSINLGAGPAAALRDLMASKDISATEAIRRALSIWKFIEDERSRGRRIALLEGDGRDQVVREVVFHD